MGAFCFLLHDTITPDLPCSSLRGIIFADAAGEEILHIHQLYQAVTARIVVEVENGTVPWIKPRKSTSLLPTNIATGNHYNGINIPLLWFAADKRGLPILPQTFSRVINM